MLIEQTIRRRDDDDRIRQETANIQTPGNEEVIRAGIINAQVTVHLPCRAMLQTQVRAESVQKDQEWNEEQGRRFEARGGPVPRSLAERSPGIAQGHKKSAGQRQPQEAEADDVQPQAEFRVLPAQRERQQIPGEKVKPIEKEPHQAGPDRLAPDSPGKVPTDMDQGSSSRRGDKHPQQRIHHGREIIEELNNV